MLVVIQQQPDELTICVGDLLTVLRKDLGYDGWYLAQNEAGREGPIPDNFVEVSFLVYIPTAQRVYSRLFLLRTEAS